MASFRVVVIGGTGAFGARVCRLLAHDPGIAVVIAARSKQPAVALAAELCRQHDRHDIVAATLDVEATDWADNLARLGADAVIHTAGPFQESDYRVAEACIRLGIHYVDLADARAFVCGVGVLDAAARQAGVLVASGASSVPALSDAAIDHLTEGLSRVDTIDIAITPGNRAPRGRATIAAILSYVGHPVRLWRGGTWTDGIGWQDLHRRVLALPDGAGLGKRWFSLCDVPDLALLPARYDVRERVAFHAGLELSILHVGLWLLSWLVRWRWIASLVPFTGILRWLADRVRGVGSDRGGMLVDVAGRGAGGRAITRRWRLMAEAGDGPWIPALASVALVRKLSRGALEARGAVPCIGLLTMEEILAEAQGRAIHWATNEAQPLYVHSIGDAYDSLPAPVARLHDVAASAVWRGHADVDGADGPLAWLAARVFRFPATCRSVPVNVAFSVRDGVETWHRTFGKHAFSSRQHAGRRRDVIVERFSIAALDMQGVASPTGIEFFLRGGRVLGVPLPRFLLPRIAASEGMDAEGRFRFDVEIGLPVIGRLVHYRGWLAPADDVTSAAAPG
ncbi:SDR family oxidoreductase [Reyranella sp. CPCC 100927]|uniref:SDR family oxidoreductase n=1 Tax=Reyranella sp. CPCC 100927 TaxID=2599616 RepID=UPI0015B77B9D|nr:SDR family oxidoreductase [Reyranella sp. CPCC 100927]